MRHAGRRSHAIRPASTRITPVAARRCSRTAPPTAADRAPCEHRDRDGRDREQEQGPRRGAARHGWSRASRLSPDSSALGMNPSAAEPATRPPKSAASRPEVRTMLCAVPASRMAAATAKPSRSGRPISTSATSGRSRSAAARAERPVRGLADDVEPVRLEHGAGAGPEAVVIVDHEHRGSHDRGSWHARSAAGNRVLPTASGWASPVSARAPLPRTVSSAPPSQAADDGGYEPCD